MILRKICLRSLLNGHWARLWPPLGTGKTLMSAVVEEPGLLQTECLAPQRLAILSCPHTILKQLLLLNQLSQVLVAYNNNRFIASHDFMGKVLLPGICAGLRRSILQSHEAATKVTQWYSAGRRLYCHALHLGRDGWKAGLTWDYGPCGLELKKAGLPAWQLRPPRTLFMYCFLWPSLRSLIASLYYILLAKRVTNMPRFKGRGHRSHLSVWGMPKTYRRPLLLFLRAASSEFWFLWSSQYLESPGLLTLCPTLEDVLWECAHLPPKH